MTGIYKIENLVNKKVYIGQAINITNRWNGHLHMLINNCHHSEHLQNAWNKYGKENFKFVIIEECEENKLTEREQYWIDYYGGINSNNNYNGRDASLRGAFSIDTKLKMSKNHADVAGVNNPMYGTLGGMYGKKHSDEWKLNASKRFRGSNNPMYGKSTYCNKGRIWVTNGSKSFLIFPTDLENYLTLGFIRGRNSNLMSKQSKYKLSKSLINSPKTKNRFWITNGVEEKLIQEDAFEKYKDKGFKRGRLSNKKLGRRKNGSQ